jgi:hypothetical protein
VVGEDVSSRRAGDKEGCKLGSIVVGTKEGNKLGEILGFVVGVNVEI